MTDLTWGEMRNFDVEDVSSASLQMKAMILEVKKFLTGEIGPGGAGVWSVLSSCDGAGNVAASDLWTAATKIVRNTAGNNHSWCRLGNTTLGLECVLDVSGSGDSWGLQVYFAPTFSGGTATARPTGPYEWGHYASSFHRILFSSFSAMRMHGLMSTRGDFWILFSRNATGDVQVALGACKLGDTKAGDSYPWASFYSGYTTVGSAQGLNKSAVCPWGSGNGGAFNDNGGDIPNVLCRTATGGAVAGYNTNDCAGLAWPVFGAHTDASRNGPLDYSANDQADGKSLTFPVLAGIAQALGHTFKGRWPDMLLGQTGVATNNVSPVMGSQEYLKVGAVWLPFTGGILSL